MGIGKTLGNVRRVLVRTSTKLSNLTRSSCLRPSESDVVIGKCVETLERTCDEQHADSKRGDGSSQLYSRPAGQGKLPSLSGFVITKTVNAPETIAVDQRTHSSEDTAETSTDDEAGPASRDAVSFVSPSQTTMTVSPSTDNTKDPSAEKKDVNTSSHKNRTTPRVPTTRGAYAHETATTDEAVARADKAAHDENCTEWEQLRSSQCLGMESQTRALDTTPKTTTTTKKKLQRSNTNLQILRVHNHISEYDERKEEKGDNRKLQDSRRKGTEDRQKGTDDRRKGNRRKGTGDENGRRSKGSSRSIGGRMRSMSTVKTKETVDIPIVDRLPGEIEKSGNSCSHHAFPFHHACSRKPKAEVLLELIQLHPSMARKRDENGSLLIHCLVDDCGSAFVPVLSELIRQFPQGLEEEDDRGRLPLHRVCRSRKKMSIEVVKVLTEASPSSLTHRVDGLLPLHMLCLNSRATPKVVELVASRAPMSVAAATTGSTPGQFPLHIACKLMGRSMPDIVAVLMRIAPEVAGIACRNGDYPLHIASAAANTATIRAILEAYPDAARICDHTGSLPVHVAYIRWHFSSLTGGEESETLEPLLLLLRAYPDSLYHHGANGERIIDSACKKPEDKLEILLGAAYPVHTTCSLQVEGFLPENLEAAQLHMIPPKIVHVLKQLHPLSVNVTHDGHGYVIAK